MLNFWWVGFPSEVCGLPFSSFGPSHCITRAAPLMDIRLRHDRVGQLRTHGSASPGTHHNQNPQRVQMVSMKLRSCLMFVCFGEVPFDVFLFFQVCTWHSFITRKTWKNMYINKCKSPSLLPNITYCDDIYWCLGYTERLEGHQHPPPQKSIKIPIQNRGLCRIAQIFEAKTGSCVGIVVTHQFSRFSFTETTWMQPMQSMWIYLQIAGCGIHHRFGESNCRCRRCRRCGGKSIIHQLRCPGGWLRLLRHPWRISGFIRLGGFRQLRSFGRKGSGRHVGHEGCDHPMGFWSSVARKMCWDFKAKLVKFTSWLQDMAVFGAVAKKISARPAEKCLARPALENPRWILYCCIISPQMIPNNHPESPRILMVPFQPCLGLLFAVFLPNRKPSKSSNKRKSQNTIYMPSEKRLRTRSSGHTAGPDLWKTQLVYEILVWCNILSSP